MKDIICFIKEFFQTYTQRRVSRSAAEFAYFFTLSIFPLLICGIAILASFNLSLENIFHEAWAADVLYTLLDYIAHVDAGTSSFLIISSITVTLTSGSAAFRAILKIMEDIQGKAKYQGIWGRIVSITFAMLLLFTIYFSIIVITFGAWAMETLERFVGVSGFVSFWHSARFLVLFVLAALVVHLMYHFTAPKSPKFTRLPGAVLATVALVIGTVIFTYFMGASARYPLLYGSLASFVLLMVWAYLCGNILICGNLLNHLLYKRKNPDAGSCFEKENVS